MSKIKEEQLETIREHQKTLNTILNDVGYLEAQNMVYYTSSAQLISKWKILNLN